VDVNAGETQNLALSKEGNVHFSGSYYEPYLGVISNICQHRMMQDVS
jgi:hypothetical protein